MKFNLKFSLKIIVFLSIVLLSLSKIKAQNPPIPSANAIPFAYPSIKSLNLQRPFVSIELNFSIWLPDSIYGQRWNFQEGDVGVSATDKNVVGGNENLLEFTKLNNDGMLSKLSGKVIDVNSIEISNFPATSTHFVFDSGKYGIRYFVLGDETLYILFAQFNDSANADVFEKILNTFKIVGEAQIKAEIQRKVVEATPKDLPQEPLLKNQQNDLKEENLKGKVSKVVEESENVSNKEIVSNRSLSQIREYNNKGYLTKAVRIDYRGNPDSIEVYGFIDGKRVSNTGYVKYPYNPPSPKPTPSKIQPEPKRDLRYTTSYEKRYQDGKLVEKIFYGNNGSIWLRQVSNYKDNQLEFLVYSSDGTLNQKYVSLLDKKGLIIEETSFDVKTQMPNLDRKYKYDYEFDKEGNWIKKTTSKVVTENGNVIFKPLFVYYRTITYYK